MELLWQAVTRFAGHLRRVEEHILARQASENKQRVKTEEFEDAEIPYESTVNVQMSNDTSDQETFEKSEIADATFYRRATRDDQEDDENNVNARTNAGFVGI
ncbi:Protein of unknown function [Gryllus bimaculatus]|nr:Protein of unknown function [Gryllus bimaculatus]